MSKELKRGGELFAAYERIYLLHVKHFGVESEADWVAVNADYDALASPFERDLFSAVISQLDRDAAKAYGQQKYVDEVVDFEYLSKDEKT